MQEGQENGGSLASEIVIEGIGASPGVAIGPCHVLAAQQEHPIEREIDEAEVPLEIARFEEAIIATRRQIKDLQIDLRSAISKSDASIFDAHLMVLDDRSFLEDVVLGLGKERKNVETIVRFVAKRYADVLSQVKDDYLKERVADILDVARRIIRNLHGEFLDLHEVLDRECVVIARDMAPSEVAGLRKNTVIGIAIDHGSTTSHTAIMARSLEIPAVMGLGNASRHVFSGDNVLLDGDKGRLIICPSEATMKEYGQVLETRAHIKSELAGLRDKPAVTRDGHEVTLSANIELPSDVEAALIGGAKGVGLFRSEYLYLTRDIAPDEDEQAEAYSDVARRLAPESVIVRTLDLGGDKIASTLKIPVERNPSMGWRAIRFCLSEPHIFKIQLRAILRASAGKNIKIMYPMVSDVQEVIEANAILEAAKEELRRRDVAFDDNIEVGVMIETPSAALTVDAIAEHVGFFSLGTNDLVQYTLAVDRQNEQVARLYKPTHPAILKLIKNTVDVGHENRIWVGVCGEMAGDPLLAPLLVGLGVDELSVSPPALPVVKDAIRSIDYKNAQGLAATALAQKSAERVRELCREVIGERAPEILELVR